MKSGVGSERLLIVLLVGGPYDGQDIVISKEEWAQGSLTRNRYRYASDSITPGVGRSSSGAQIFTWVDSAR